MNLKNKTLLISQLGEHHTHKIGALIAKGKRLISVGWNKSKTHPKSTHPWKHIHAEMSAIINSNTSLRGCTMYVARIGKDNQLRNAKPCKYCMELIHTTGIKEIIFTNNSNWVKLLL